MSGNEREAEQQNEDELPDPPEPDRKNGLTLWIASFLGLFYFGLSDSSLFAVALPALGLCLSLIGIEREIYRLRTFDIDYRPPLTDYVSRLILGTLSHSFFIFFMAMLARMVCGFVDCQL